MLFAFTATLTILSLYDEFQGTPGKFAANSVGGPVSSAAVSCASCPSSTYSPTNASASCLPCPVEFGLTSIPGSKECDRAIEGYFMDPTATIPIAQKCPPHATCPGSLSLPQPVNGYWSAPLTSTKTIPRIYKCMRRTCKGAKNTNGTCWSVGSTKSDACDYDEFLCKDGSKGPLCGSCSVHWTFDFMSSTCKECDKTLDVWQILIIVIVAIFVTVGIAICFRPTVCLHKVRDIAKYFYRSWDRALLKICWSTFQIIGAIPLSSNSDFPQPFATWLQYLSVTSFSFFSSDCVFRHQSYYRKVYIMGFLPPIFAALIILGYALWAKARPSLLKKIQRQRLPYALLILSCMLFFFIDCHFKLPTRQLSSSYFPYQCPRIKIAHCLPSQRNCLVH